MGNITIVTAFFDIGRGNWTPEKGLPHYLQRSNDTYFERFAHTASLDNELVVFTSEEFVEKVMSYRIGKESKTKVISIDYKNNYNEARLAIATVQTDEKYHQMIFPHQRKTPEYWSADYVLVNALKSHFVNQAISEGFVSNELVAWIDFGYCRDAEMLGGHTEWSYDFDPTKIHFFQQKEWDPNNTIQNVIANNDVHMLGAKIVAGKKMWLPLEQLISHSITELIKNNMVDDDQTLMLMSYLLKPELFEIHKIVPDDSWIKHNSIFKEYNV
jgi:hypothetical protein